MATGYRTDDPAPGPATRSAAGSNGTSARLAVQNCHRVAAFSYDAVGGERFQRFVSPRGQLLNQSPELRNC